MSTRSAKGTKPVAKAAPAGEPDGMGSGAGLACLNWIVTLVVLALLCTVYHYRMRAEEAMLLERLGQPYAEYKAHTRRLLPFVY